MEQLFSAIPSVLNDLGADSGANEAVVFAAWKRCAGELISGRSAPVEYFENRLVVAVQDATWARHLEDLSPQMVAKLNASLGHGSVKFIEFRIDPAGFEKARAEREEKRTVRSEPIAEAPASLREAANAIADEQLRESFLNAAAAYLAKK
jgi:hypothetical protein